LEFITGAFAPNIAGRLKDKPGEGGRQDQVADRA